MGGKILVGFSMGGKVLVGFSNMGGKNSTFVNIVRPEIRVQNSRELVAAFLLLIL